ncbi:MAG TPA: hypothetical protein VE971_06060 [Candidatus Eisenbacteria bacterium]|nr:hypothetical protein [Candidatus Eisenbacteria bacterium]
MPNQYDNDGPENVAMDFEGNRLPISSDEVKETGREIAMRGRLLLVISSIDDALAVNILEKPTPELISALENAIIACKKEMRRKT